MRRALTITVMASVAAVLLVTAPALASSSTTIIQDASDGRIDGTYSASAVRAALAVVRSDPVYAMYSDIEGVIANYLAGLSSKGNGSTGNGSTGSGSTATGPQTSSTPGASVATPTAKPKVKKTPATHVSSAGASSGRPTVLQPAASAGNRATEPIPAVSASERARLRLAALPWFFVVIGVAVLAGGALVVRRRRAS